MRVTGHLSDIGSKVGSEYLGLFEENRYYRVK